MNTMELTKEERNIENMQKMVSDKRRRHSISSGIRESVKYISVTLLFMVLSLGAGFAAAAVLAGDMFWIFKNYLEQPIMAAGAFVAMLLIKKEGKITFPKSKKVTPLFLIGLMVVGFASISAFSYFLLSLEAHEVHFDLKKQLAAMFIAPICEEFLTRYMLTAAIRRNNHKVSIIALLITAFVFAMMHTPATMLSFSRFMIFALFIGYIYQKTGSYKACVIFHFGSNAGATCVYYFANGFSMAAKKGLTAAFIVLFIAALVIVIKEFKKIMSIDSDNNENAR